jgi:hypothetical protein
MKVQEERNFVVRERLRSMKLLTPPVAAQLDVPWRTNGVIVQCVFFVLAALAAGAFYGLTNALGVPFPGVVTGAICIAVAEYLIGVRRWFFTGVEAALWLAALVAMIADLPSSGRAEALLVIGAACAIAGARVRNPLLGAAAAVFVTAYAEKFDRGVAAALLIGALALLALVRTWRRPSTEWLWAALAVIMPVAGWFCADDRWRELTIALYLGYGALALGLALWRRHHASFLAALIAIAIALNEFRNFIDVPAEAYVAVAGASSLLLAYAVTRALRGRATGFVLTPEELTGVDEALQIAATLAMKPQSEAPPAPAQDFEGGGGSFGGAGASGQF